MKIDENRYMKLWQFLNYEVYLLDTFRFEEWLSNISEKISYVMARRIVNENKGFDYDVNSPLMRENYSSLKARIQRLKSVYAWGEIPNSRYIHVLGWVNMELDENTKDIFAYSSVMFVRNREDSYENEIMTYQRRDRIIQIDEKMKLINRLIIPDQPVIGLSTLSNLF